MFSGKNVVNLGILEGTLLVFVCIFASKTSISYAKKLSGAISLICLIGILYFASFWLLLISSELLSDHIAWFSFFDPDRVVILYSFTWLLPQTAKSLLIFFMRHREDDDSIQHSMTRILNSLNEERKYFNQLRKELNMGGGQLRRNLDRLISRGQISKQTIGKNHYYSLTSHSPSPLN